MLAQRLRRWPNIYPTLGDQLPRIFTDIHSPSNVTRCCVNETLLI